MTIRRLPGRHELGDRGRPGDRRERGQSIVSRRRGPTAMPRPASCPAASRAPGAEQDGVHRLAGLGAEAAGEDSASRATAAPAGPRRARRATRIIARSRRAGSAARRPPARRPRRLPMTSTVLSLPSGSRSRSFVGPPGRSSGRHPHDLLLLGAGGVRELTDSAAGSSPSFTASTAGIGSSNTSQPPAASRRATTCPSAASIALIPVTHGRPSADATRMPTWKSPVSAASLPNRSRSNASPSASRT